VGVVEGGEQVSSTHPVFHNTVGIPPTVICRSGAGATTVPVPGARRIPRI